MALIDSLLLDPYQFEFWISNLGPGAPLGSGTASDPWNAATIPYPTVAVTSITSVTTGGITTATVSAPNHGFGEGAMVTIAGVLTQYDGGGADDSVYVGTFQIHVVDGNTFSYTMSGAPTLSLALGTITCWREREQFDPLMRAIPPYSTVHISGLIDTKGLARAGGWKPKDGQRLLGSSMAQTTLRLVGGSIRGDSYSAIGVGQDQHISGFQAEDFTVDCNTEGQINPYVNCGAIGLQGGANHTRIRRVRAIRFGSKAPDTYTENFVFGIGGPTGAAYFTPFSESVDNVIEECVAELPCPNIYWNSSIFVLFGAEDGITQYHRASALRNNFVNCQIVYGQLAYVDTISVAPPGADSGLVTLTTKTPHGLAVPGNVSVQGIRVQDSTNNRFNGVFKIEALDSTTPATKLTYTVFATDSLHGEVGMGGAPVVDSGTIAGAPISPHQLPVSIVAVSGFQVTISTPIPHNRTVNNVVKIGGITVNGILPDDLINNPFNRTFAVTSVISKNQVVYTLGANPPDPLNFAGSDPVLGEGHIALSADNGTSAVVEGNRILHCILGGPWHDTNSTRDLIIRGNRYYDVGGGPNQGVGGQVLNAKSCVLTPSGLTVTCDAGSAGHDLAVGQGVFISDAGAFNGIFVIKSVTQTTFTYDMLTSPGTSNANGFFAGYAQVGTWIIEDNIIELAPTRPNYWAEPTAIYVGLSNFTFLTDLPPRFRQVIVRGNVIRQLADSSVSTYAAITVQKAENLIIENNIIDLGQSVPIQFQKCGAVRIFNNRTPAGNLIQGYNRDTQKNQDEIATMIEDSVLLSI